MPAELPGLPEGWTAADPEHDGLVSGDPLPRRPGLEAARILAAATSSQEAFGELAELLHAKGVLGRRERQVVELFVEGLGRDPIAARLQLRPRQVRDVLEGVRRRFGLRFCRLF